MNWKQMLVEFVAVAAMKLLSRWGRKNSRRKRKVDEILDNDKG